MPQPTVRSVGAVGSGTTSCVAAAPTGGNAPQANDILYVAVESTDSTTTAGTPNTPGGYSKIFEETQGAGATGVTTLTIFAKRAGAGEGDVTIDGVGNHCSAVMIVVKDAVTSGTAWTVGAGNGANTGNGTVTGLNTPVADCLVLAFVATTRDANNSATFSAWTNANLSSITERVDNTVSTGAGGGLGIADGGKATAGATGDTTVTIAVSVQWRAVHVATSPETNRQAQVSWVEMEAPSAPRRAQVSWTELEVPTAPRRAQVSWSEFEIPTAPRRSQVSWTELEVPDSPVTDRRAQASWAELEVPTAPRRAQVSWSEMEAPSPPRRAQMSWTELEVPTAPRRAQVSWTETEIPTPPRRGQVSWSEFETPTPPRRAQISWAEMEISEETADDDEEPGVTTLVARHLFHRRY